MLLDGGSAALNTADGFGVRPHGVSRCTCVFLTPPLPPLQVRPLHKAVAFRRVAVLRELLREPYAAI
jgi:hypothetical protein